eukprot:RCo045437
MSTITELLHNLEAAESADVQVAVLNELCTLLCIGMEELVRSFDSRHAVRLLLRTLQRGSSDTNVVVLCHRAVALVMEMVPRSCATVLGAGAMPLFVRHLQNAVQAGHASELVEEILKSLERVSRDDPQAIIAFPGAVQATISAMHQGPTCTKAALAILANVCRRFSRPAAPQASPTAEEGAVADTCTSSHRKRSRKGSEASSGASPHAALNDDEMITGAIAPAVLQLLREAAEQPTVEVFERACACVGDVADPRREPPPQNLTPEMAGTSTTSSSSSSSG